MIPLNQKIRVLKKTNVSDGWGGKISSYPLEYRCRIAESTRSLKNVSTEEDVRNVRNREIVSVADVFLRGLADITEDDTLEYTDELGRTRQYKPISIKVIRGISGEALFTKIEVGGK